MDTVTQTVKRVSHMTLIVQDQEAAIDFYAKTFGTEIRGDNEFEMGDEKVRWVTIGIPGDDLEIAITLPMPGPDGQVPTAGDANMSVVDVDDVDGLCETVTQHGGTVVSPPEDLPWGRSAVIRDPSGNPWNLVMVNWEG